MKRLQGARFFSRFAVGTVALRGAARRPRLVQFKSFLISCLLSDLPDSSRFDIMFFSRESESGHGLQSCGARQDFISEPLKTCGLMNITSVSGGSLAHHSRLVVRAVVAEVCCPPGFSYQTYFFFFFNIRLLKHNFLFLHMFLLSHIFSVNRLRASVNSASPMIVFQLRVGKKTRQQ